jgi:VanZ family protein
MNAPDDHDAARRAADAPPGATGSHPIARFAFAIGLLMAAYASLRPFTGWRDRGVGAFAFLQGPLAFPFYWDAFLNTLGYLLLGLTGFLALAPRLRGVAAVAVITLALSATSVCVEALQTFLPGRLASLTDVVTDAAGALAGALIGHLASPRLLAGGGAQGLRRRLLVPGWQGDVGLVLLAFWLLALLAPRIVLFGTGDFRYLRPFHGYVLHPPHVYVWVEALVASINLAGLALLVRVIVAEGARRIPILLAIVATGLVARSVGYGLFWTANHAFDWLTRGAWIGLALGLPVALVALRLPRRFAAPVGACVLAAAIVAVNVAPPNPFIAARPRPTRVLELEPLSATTRTTALVWPFAVVLFLAWPRREKATR